MRAIDTGVLLCAINRFAPEHARASTTVESLASGERPWAIPVSVLHEFLRLVTHPHAAVRALNADHAQGFLDLLLASPSARLLTPGASHVATLRGVLQELGTASTLPPGLETAVLLREHDVRELLSADPAMRRYRFFSVRDPLHGPPWTPDEPPQRRYRRLRPDAASSSTTRPRERRSA